MKSLGYSYRVLATVFCFAVFGIGGLVLGLVFLALLVPLIRNGQKRTALSRNVVRLFFRFFIGLMRFVRVMTWELQGGERLNRPGLLVLANHPSLIDTVFMLSFMPNASCVVRGSLLKNPALWGPLSAAGYISNDRGPDLLETCRATLDRGDSLLIFPEGTRTPMSGQVQLERGAANVAVRCRKSVTPVVITCTPRVLAKAQPWWDSAPQRPHFVIRVHEDLPLAEFVNEETPEPIAVRRLNEHLRAFFQRETTGAINVRVWP